MPRGRTHKCAGCATPVPLWAIACQPCWARLPVALRAQLSRESHQCRLAHIAHTQKLIDLRAQALAALKPSHEPQQASAE